ncbi:MAG: DUF448 domain-containing protein [Myxococcales bacterium]|nr:DUF448 domain-containing protein [Myxococcales bacterium]MCB9643084.1 DUF448 domain-containing protein [Myxococcales bacterium]
MTEKAAKEPEETGHLRTCIATRKRLPPEQMLRLVLDPSGQRVHIDYLQKLPGRGAYVCADRESLRKAVEKGGIKKAFRSNVQADTTTLLQEAAEASARQLSSLLSLGFRAGMVIPGNSRVEHVLRQGTALLLLIADDAAPSVKSKFSRWAQRFPIPCFTTLTKDALGVPLRLPTCSLVAVTDPGFAEKLRIEAKRAQDLQPPLPAGTTPSEEATPDPETSEAPTSPTMLEKKH